jgi:hypothetical protein
MEGSAVRGGWPSLAAAAVLAVSLGLKLAVQNAVVEEDSQGAVTGLATALSEVGYSVSVPRTDLPIVRAEQPGCTLTARVLDPHATYHDTELHKLQPGWRIAYVWRGKARSILPRIGPLGEYYVAREMARLGLTASRAPVVMLSLSPGCDGLPVDALAIRETLRGQADQGPRTMP